jgi:hypothetical protein
VTRERKITIYAHGMEEAQFEDLFDRVADAAHQRDEVVSCGTESVSDLRLIVRLLAAIIAALGGNPDLELGPEPKLLGTTSQNHGNARLNRRNTSGFKGVSWDSNRQKWTSAIAYCGRHRHLGRFDTAWEAARAYNEAAVAQWGEFALTNKLPVVRDPEDRIGQVLEQMP